MTKTLNAESGLNGVKFVGWAWNTKMPRWARQGRLPRCLTCRVWEHARRGKRTARRGVPLSLEFVGALRDGIEDVCHGIDEGGSRESMTGTHFKRRAGIVACLKS